MPISKKEPSIEEVKFVRNLAKGLNPQKALMDVKPDITPDSAKVMASRMRKYPHIREELQRTLERMGITMEKALKPIGDALDNDNLEMRLKGSDRAVKIMTMGEEDNNTIIFNQGDIVKSKYVKD